MPKWLIFLYRYITAPYRLRKWFNLQTLVVFFISAAFFTALAWAAPANRPQFLARPGMANVDPTQTPDPGPTRAAPLPPEYLENSEQTVGITLVGAVLVVIVVMGVLIYLPRHDNAR